MAWWLRPCGPGAGSGRAQDAQNSPAKPVLADGGCYARRTQSHIHASRGVVGLVRPQQYPSTMRAERDPTIDQSWGRTLVVRAAAAHCCSLLVLCVNPPPPLSPPVCSWRGSICAPCMECPRHERRRVRKFPNDECAPWASTPRSTFLVNETHLLATGPQAQPQRVDWADDEEATLSVAPLQDRSVTSSHRGVASRAVVHKR